MEGLRLGRSILAMSAAAFAVAFASVIGVSEISSIAKAQPTPAPRNPETGFNDTFLEQSVLDLEGIFNSGPNSSNPTGRPLRNWTPDHFEVLSTNMLTIIRAVISSERYDLVDRLKPENMGRAEYSRAILRESASRNNGDLENFYSRRLAAPVSSVTVSRPIGVPTSAQVRVTADPSILAIHDAAVSILRNPQYAAVVFEPDVAQAMGRPDRALAGVPVRTDASTYDLGYTAGAAAALRAGQSLALSVGFVEAPEKVQRAYCMIAFDIFRSAGRTVDQTEAFSAGFLQARIDARSNFQGQEVPLAFNSPCPSVSAPLTNQDRLDFAIVR